LTAITRKNFLKTAAAAGILSAAGLPARIAAAKPGGKILTKKIPKTGEELPVVGLGTWQTFDIGSDPDERAQRRAVLQALFDNGASVIDSSPMYGRSEGVVGDLLAEMGARKKAFIATKVWTDGKQNGIDEMNRSFALFKTDMIDLMQVHNLVDTDTHMATMRDWQEKGRLRYLGVTHYVPSAIPKIMDAVAAHPVQFVQQMYSLEEPEAGERLLPYLQEKGVAFIANRPFGGGGQFSRVRGKPLPGWAAEWGVDSWARYFLKFVISHPAVTCAIPGTARPHYMADNVGAGHAPLPDEKTRQKMLAYWRDL
jgi:aryl-alcohol dehydrogenase-like predicted oxidoreductase